jgi:hypothetical protein
MNPNDERLRGALMDLHEALNLIDAWLTNEQALDQHGNERHTLRIIPQKNTWITLEAFVDGELVTSATAPSLMTALIKLAEVS